MFANHLKHILCKSGDDELKPDELNDLIRVACDFVFKKYGSEPSLEVRKSVADVLHVRFTKVQPKLLFNKLSQRVKNLRRRKRPEIIYNGDRGDRNKRAKS